MTISSILNNFQESEKENNENLKSFILSTMSKIINNIESILKMTSKCLYNLKSLSSKSDKQMKSNKKLKN